MQKDKLDDYSMVQLIDLLAKSTKELLTMMNKKDGDGILLRDKRKQVQLIQEAIDQRKFPDKKKN
ncbi:MAG TPA: hypothetical protein VKC90_07705 [Chitinophagaceae bacterium]|nr:hypothetical protein [Chitinophagaceae bacterium]